MGRIVGVYLWAEWNNYRLQGKKLSAQINDHFICFEENLNSLFSANI